MNNRELAREKAFELRNKGLTWEYIGSVLEVSRKTAKRLFDEYVNEEKKEEVIGPLLLERFNPLQIYGDCMVTCDWHVPLHSPRLVNKLFEIAYKNDIKKLIIGGDFFNMDHASSYLPHQPEAGFKREREEGTNIIDAALDVFDDIYFSWGNHDYRIVKLWGYKHSFTAAMNWVLEDLGDKLDRVHFTDLDYVEYYPVKGQKIRICHPVNFSTAPLTVARGLVPKYLCDVMTAHSHHFAQGVALDGVHRVYDGGGLFEPKITEYVQKTNKFHHWVQGFHMFKDGLCHPYSPVYGNL